MVSETQEWRKWVQGTVGPAWDLEKGRAWQENVLAFLESPCPASSCSCTVPSLSQLAQIKDALVNNPRKRGSETLPF